MAQLVKCEVVSIRLRQFFQAFRDKSVGLRNNEVFGAAVRNCIDQRLNISRNHKPTSGIEGLVHIAHNILPAEIQLAALNRQYAVLDVAELQAANLAHTKRKPHGQQARQFDLCTANHVNDLFDGRQFLDVRNFRRQRDIEIRTDAVHLQCCYDQILCFSNRLPAHGHRILIDRSLQCEAASSWMSISMMLWSRFLRMLS